MPGGGTGFAAVRAELAAAVGAAHVLTDPDATVGYLTDWTGRFTGVAAAVVRPRTTTEVAEVLRICADAGLSVCPQGGNTGLVGGSVPPAAATGARPGIVLSTTRMIDIDPVDEVARCVGAQAGATLAAVGAAAAAAGLEFGVDLASRDSATVGGIVAANAGGIRMIRHGNTRAQLLGIEAVLADGRVLRRWSPLIKDNVGYDLPGLLAGSEGTLAVLTRVLFRLVTPAPRTTVAVIGIESVATALAVIGRVRATGLLVEAAEIMTEAGIALVHARGARRPLASAPPFALLLEVSGRGDLETALAAVLDETAGVGDAVAEPGPARALWAVREDHTESIARSSSTPVLKFDVSFPLDELARGFGAFDDLGSDAGYPCRSIVFGHIGDGNLHVSLLDVPPAAAARATAAVYRIVAAGHGSISAEHGIGRAKTAWTHLGRSDVDRSVMRAVKDALDPRGLLNPGVLFGERPGSS
ncbi:MAG: FAD-binding oxidoreductase [Gordonia sp. (in: high G+C Gram-positive bacteria)]